MRSCRVCDARAVVRRYLCAKHLRRTPSEVTLFVLSHGKAVSTVRYDGRDYNLWSPGPPRYVWKGTDLVQDTKGPYAIPDPNLVQWVEHDVTALVQCAFVGDEQLHDWAVERLVRPLFRLISALDVDDSQYYKVVSVPHRSPAVFERWLRAARGLDIFLCYHHSLNQNKWTTTP